MTFDSVGNYRERRCVVLVHVLHPTPPQPNTPALANECGLYSSGWNILFVNLSLTEGEVHYPFFEKCVPVPTMVNILPLETKRAKKAEPSMRPLVTMSQLSGEGMKKIP